MTLDSLRLLRSVLLRSFIVGTLFYILSVIVTYAGWSMWVELAHKYLHADEGTLTRLVLHFFVNAKFFLLFVLLTPALGIHWAITKERAHKP